MVIYVPGTEETDPKKQNMSLQAIATSATATAASTATNTTNIAALTAAGATSDLLCVDPVKVPVARSPRFGRKREN
jgi:hypothetical protein